ncbi:Protein of unknown function, partial [Gryllus bimaculatus]
MDDRRTMTDERRSTKHEQR